jgi:hypothetical protein
MESLENRFDLLENDLEIKFESLKIIFDEYCEKTIDDLNKFENILIKRSKESEELGYNKIRISIKSYKKIVSFYIGASNISQLNLTFRKFGKKNKFFYC